MLNTGSVHSDPAEDDGLRILVARFRGRGLPAERYDVWMANLGPSESLLRAFQAGEVSWAVLQRRYKGELFADSEVDAGNRTIRNRGQKFTLRLIRHLAEEGNVTLLCHCPEDELHCHRHILKSVIAGSRI